jgi:hypothetical protein
MTDLTALTDDEARDLLARVYADVQRRDALAQAPAQAEALAATYAAAIGRKDGDPYQPVTGAHDAYPPGSIVSEDGEYYRATAWASHAPGTTGAPWERVWANGDGWTATPPAPTAPTVAPWSATAAYSVGNRCTKDGRVWECLVAHGAEYQGTWAPGPATPTVWRDIGPA